jgi:predicted membrane chloride channel (bestrophin family)
MASMVRRTISVRRGVAILNKVGFRGNHSDWGEYARWLGLRHERRVWGELMSNAIALMIELIVWIREQRIADSRKQDGAIEADRVRQEREAEAKSRRFIATLRS